jgi:hypothetical protein
VTAAVPSCAATSTNSRSTGELSRAGSWAGSDAIASHTAVAPVWLICPAANASRANGNPPSAACSDSRSFVTRGATSARARSNAASDVAPSCSATRDASACAANPTRAASNRRATTSTSTSSRASSAVGIDHAFASASASRHAVIPATASAAGWSNLTPDPDMTATLNQTTDKTAATRLARNTCGLRKSWLWTTTDSESPPQV